MIKDERYEKILEILENERYISATALAKKLYVSLPTVRRDLTELQRRNLIIRSHGGAKKAENGSYMIPLEFRKGVKQAEKKLLCQAAAKLVTDGSIIFIDASTTMLPLAEYLSQYKNLTVITNGIPMTLMLSKYGIKTFTTGGEVLESSRAYAGVYAEEFISHFNFDVMLFSSHGVTSNGNISDTSLPEAMLRRAVMKNTKKKVYVCDGEKFNVSAPYNVAPICEMDTVITNGQLPSTFELDRKKVVIVK